MRATNDSRRPCFVKEAEYKKAIFHRWVDTSFPKEKGFILQTLALVEYEDGSIAQIQPKKLIFADGGDFDKFTWKNPFNKEED